MSVYHPMRAQSLPNPASAEKLTEEPLTHKTAQSTVTCIYQIHVGGCWRHVTILWCKNIMNHSLSLIVNSPEGEFLYSCKIDVKPWQFWGKKGCKSFEIEGTQVDIYWDFRSAKFASSPEPISDYYVAVVAEEEVVLMLGDHKKKLYKRSKSRPALIDAFQFYKKENVFAKKSFCTRAKFDGKRKEHDIVVESSISGPKDPEMWVSVDGVVLIHVKNLQWKFRGNQTVSVNKQPVQVLWDVHDWLFNSPGTGHGLFIFKPGATTQECESDKEGSGHGSDTSNGSKYCSTKSKSPAPEFTLFLYAWKID